MFGYGNQRNKCKTCLETKKRPAGISGEKYWYEGDENYTNERK